MEVIDVDDGYVSFNVGLDKSLAGMEKMVVRGAAGRKILHSRGFEEECLYFMKKGSDSITAIIPYEYVKSKF